MKKTIWILEDEYEIINVYKDALEENYHLKLFKQIPLFLNEVKKLPSYCDLAIIDLNIYNNNFLNHISDASLLKGFPFIIISGNYSRSDIEKCYELGAVDYIVKPFMIEELQAKIKHSIQITKKKSPLHDIVESFINSDELTQKEVKILNLFLSKEEHKLKRDQIINNIWKGIKVHPKTLDVHLYNLRRKIKEKGLYINCIDGIFILDTDSQIL